MKLLDRLQNKKLGLIELISMGYHIYFENFTAIIVTFCVIDLPISIVFTLVMVNLETRFSHNYLFYFMGNFFLYLVDYIGFFIFWIILSLIISRYIYQRENNNETILGEIFYNFIPLLLKWEIQSILLLNARFLVNSVIRLILFVVPGLIYLLNNVYYPLAFILRKKRGTQAFTYSQNIVEGNRWKVFLLLFVSILLELIIPIIIRIITGNIDEEYLSFSELLLSRLLHGITIIGINIALILLFLNIEYDKKYINRI